MGTDTLQEALPAADAGVFVCVCGPAAFNEAAKGALRELGHNMRQVLIMA